MRNPSRVGFGFLGLIALALQGALAADLYVPSQYSTIQDAIDAAQPGDTIKVSPGVYKESVKITKSSIKIIGDPGASNKAGPGADAPVLDGSGLQYKSAFVIEEGVADVLIEGFEIRNYGPSGKTSANGIVAWNAGTSNITVRYNYIHDVGYAGILIGNGWGSPQGLHRGWSILYNVVRNVGAYGFDIENAANTVISHNEIYSTPYYALSVLALATESDTSITSEDIEISYNRLINLPDRGFNLLAWVSTSGTAATLRNVRVFGNEASGCFNLLCAWIMGSGASLSDVKVTNNVFVVSNPKSNEYVINLADVGGSSEFGENTVTITGTIGGGGTFFHALNITGGATGTWQIRGNQINGNNVGSSSAGIRIRSHIPSSAELEIIGNSIKGFAYGIRSDGLPTGSVVKVHANAIMQNSQSGVTNGSGATIDASCNYWGDPTGPYHPTLNPHGKGNAISDNVTLGTDNRQWWTSEGGPCAYHYFLTMEAPYPPNGHTIEIDGQVLPSFPYKYPCPEGGTVTVKATAGDGFTFVEWQEKIDSSWVSINGAATHTITMDKDRTIRALFLPARYSLSVTVQPPGGGTVTVSPNPGADGKYAAGTTVTLTVTPAAGFQFVCWDGPNGDDVTGTFPTYTIVMDGNKLITAVFDRIPIFSEDFDDITGWTATGLWHTCTDNCFSGCDKLQGTYAHYAKPGTCSYDTGARTQGILTSPVIRIPKNATLTLQFDFARHVEYNTRVFRDRTSVQVRFGFVRMVSGREYVTWTGWITIWARSSRDRSPECGTFTYNFRTWSYERMEVRFVFDSVDRFDNNYPGWAIDNVVVKPAGGLQPGALEVADIGLGWEEPAEAETLTVVNTPNPVRDVHTTTFTVLGVEAEAVRVEVYDLTGRLVWKAEAPGNELVWHTEDLTGLPLANGVYLYIAYVKVDGEWIRLEPQKLVILR